jgi:hypothetical protein
MNNGTNPKAELAAMRKIVTALEPLDEPTRERIVAWAYDMFRTDADTTPVPDPTGGSPHP